MKKKPSNPTCDPATRCAISVSSVSKGNKKKSHTHAALHKRNPAPFKRKQKSFNRPRSVQISEGNKKKISYRHCTKRIRHCNVRRDHVNLQAAARTTPQRQPLDQFVLTGISSTSKLPLARHRDVRPRDQFDL